MRNVFPFISGETANQLGINTTYALNVYRVFPFIVTK